MRWLVEVTPMGKQETQSYCVDAESWQNALQTARGMRSEAPSMSGFSIELLEEGYRAVDPMARVRYVMKHAPAGMELTANGTPHVPPDVPSEALTVPNLDAEDSGQQVQTDVAKKSGRGKKGKTEPPRAQLQMKKPVQISVPKNVQAVTEEVRAAAVDLRRDPKTDPPPNVSTAPEADQTIEIVRSEPPEKLAESMPTVDTLQMIPVAEASSPDSGDNTHTVEVNRSEPPQSTAVGAALPGLPAVEVLTKREQEPDTKSPIVYREYAFFVPPGTSDANAERVLMGQLEIVKRQIASYTVRKFVNLAVFDMRFTGKPPAPPIVTLTWKDWSGAPIVGFPRQGKKASIAPPAPTSVVTKKASVPPPAQQIQTQPIALTQPAPQPIPLSQQAPQPIPLSQQAPQPIPLSQQAAQAIPLSQTAPMTPQVITQPIPQASQPPQHVPQQSPQQAQFAQQAPAPQFVQQPQQAQQQYAQQQPQPMQQPAPQYAQQQPPLQQTQQSAPQAKSVAQADPFKERKSTPPPASSRPAARATPVPVRSSAKLVAAGAQRGRVAGDDLISALFEAMHDLHFLRDALEGGDFCLALANEMMPSRAGLVHVYDVNKRDFIVACALGTGAESLLGKRIADSDSLLLSAMKKRKSIVVPDAAHGEAASIERYRILGGSKSVIVTPVMFGARALASIELINPVDTAPFTEDEGHAMNYIAEQFAEFIGSHGLVLETDKILAHRAAAHP